MELVSLVVVRFDDECRQSKNDEDKTADQMHCKHTHARLFFTQQFNRHNGLVVPHHKLSSKGLSAFSVAAPSDGLEFFARLSE